MDIPPDKESSSEPVVIRWIPWIPLSAGFILLAIFVIWAGVL